MSAFPEEIMQAAESIAADIPSRVRPLNREFAAIAIARALMARDKRAAEIARKHPGVNYQSVGWVKWRLPSGQDIATAILTYDRPEKDNG